MLSNTRELLERQTALLGVSVSPKLLPDHRESSLKISAEKSQKMPGYELSLTAEPVSVIFLKSGSKDKGHPCPVMA